MVQKNDINHCVCFIYYLSNYRIIELSNYWLKIECRNLFTANIAIIIGNKVLNTINIYAAVNISINNDAHPLNQ